MRQTYIAMVGCMISMVTSSNGNIFRVTGHLCGEFTGPRWIPRKKVTRSSDVFFDLRLNKRWSKQSWGWWFKTQSCPLWRHRNEDYSFQLWVSVVDTGKIPPVYWIFIAKIGLRVTIAPWYIRRLWVLMVIPSITELIVRQIKSNTIH